MKFLLYCLLATAVASGCSNVETIENRNDDGVLLEKYTRKKSDSSKHGRFMSFYLDGKLHEERNFKNDILDGESKIYNENGKVDYIEHHKNGQFEGTYQKYYESGQLSNEGEYVNNEMSGIWKRWYENGQLREEVNFAANNENGPFKEYHENGKTKTTGEYINGDNEQGELLIYDENGELSEKMICEYGVCATKWRKGEGDIEVNLERIKKLAELKKKANDLDLSN